MVEYTEASVIRVRIAILADAAAYREKEDVGEGVNMYIHTYTRGYIVARIGRTGYNPVESKAGLCARVACTCAGGGHAACESYTVGFRHEWGINVLSILQQTRR